MLCIFLKYKRDNPIVFLERKYLTLAVLDRGYFLEFYGNRSIFDKGRACEKMFQKISTAAYDSTCYSDGEEDFLRSVPCENGELCPDEDNKDNVVPKSQLTYRIQDLVQSRYGFWNFLHFVME